MNAVTDRSYASVTVQSDKLYDSLHHANLYAITQFAYNNNNNNQICKAPECQKTSVTTGGGLAQLLATLVGSTKLLYVGPG